MKSIEQIFLESKELFETAARDALYGATETI